MQECQLKDICPGSLLQEGPAWLKHPRHSWSHCSREFCCKSFPEEETKHPIHILLIKSRPKDFWVEFILGKSLTWEDAVQSYARILLVPGQLKSAHWGVTIDNSHGSG